MAVKSQIDIVVTGGDSVEAASKKLDALKQKLNDLHSKKSLNILDTDELKAVNEEIAKTTGEITSLNNQIGSIGGDTSKIEGFKNAVNGIEDGFQSAKASMILYENESDNVVQALDDTAKKVSSLNSLQGVANKTNTEGSRLLSLATVKQGALNASKKVGTVVTQGLTKASQFLTSALNAIPLVAITAAISYLIPKIKEWILGTERMKEAQDALNDTLSVEKDFLQETVKTNDYLTKKAIADAKARGATAEEIRKLERKGLETNLQEYQKYSDELQKQFEDVNINNYETAQEYDDKLKEIAEEQFNNNKRILDLERDLDLKAVNDKIATQDELTKQRELQSAKAEAQRIKDEEARKKAAQDQINYEEGRLKILGQLTLDKEMEFAQRRLNAKIITENEYNLRVLELQTDYAQADKERREQEFTEFWDELMAEQDAELSAIEAQYEKKKALREAEINDTLQGEQLLQDARRNALETGFNIAQSFSQKNKTLSNTLLAVQKGLAIAQIIVDTQKEIAGYYANPTWSAFPDGGAAIKTTYALAAKTRAATSIASIAATTIGQIATPSGGGNGGGGFGGSVNGNNPNIQGFVTTNGGGQQRGEQGAQRVYVLETDIRRVGNNIDDIYSQATVR